MAIARALREGKRLKGIDSVREQSAVTGDNHSHYPIVWLLSVQPETQPVVPLLFDKANQIHKIINEPETDIHVQFELDI